MADLIIPLTTAPHQSLDPVLSVSGKTIRLSLTISYSEVAQYWLMDVADQQGNSLLASIPLVTGDWPAANVLAQYGYLGIGSAYIVNAKQAKLDIPNSTDLGTDFVLWWSDVAD